MPDSRGRWRPFRREATKVRELPSLGPAWHIVDWTPPRDFDEPIADRFLAIGPGGVFSVLVVAHGRTRVLLAGDVIQSEGKRYTYVHEARRSAHEVSRQFSTVIGHNVPVTAVLVLDGDGVISVHGLPKDCLVATGPELDRLLLATGARISAGTAGKLARAARWLPRPGVPPS